MKCFCVDSASSIFFTGMRIIIHNIHITGSTSALVLHVHSVPENSVKVFRVHLRAIHFDFEFCGRENVSFQTLALNLRKTLAAL